MEGREVFNANRSASSTSRLIVGILTIDEGEVVGTAEVGLARRVLGTGQAAKVQDVSECCNFLAGVVGVRVDEDGSDCPDYDIHDLGVFFAPSDNDAQHEFAARGQWSVSVRGPAALKS